MDEQVYVSAKKQFSALGLTMVIGTVLFIGVQYLTGWLYTRAAGEENWNYNFLIIAEELPTYLFVMPFTIWLLGKLPGTTLQKKKIGFWQFLGAVACCFGIMISCNIIGLILTGIIGAVTGNPVRNQISELISELHPLVGLVVVSICAPIFEELIFRKMLVTRTVKYGEGTAILISGLMFGLFHGNLNQFAYATFLGAFLAFLFIKTGDIRITIGIHMIVNFSSSVASTFLMRQLDYPSYVDLYASGDMAAINAFILEKIVWFLLFFGYIILEYASAIVGIILLIVFHKKLKAGPGEITLDKGRRFSTIFCNVGMIMFCLIWIVMIVLQLAGLR